jgi:hypothetical protein
MKSSALLAMVALLSACAQSPTGPSTPAFSAPSPGMLREARNPAGTGQPGAECGSDNALTEPNGFGTDGFANAETKYAGSDGTPSAENGNSHAVSQYDVACFQISNK